MTNKKDHRHTRKDKPAKLTGMVIDMRTPVEFRDGTIPGAVNKNLRQLTELQGFKDKTIQIHLFGDVETTTAAKKYLEMFGFLHVSVLRQPVIYF